MFTSKQFKALFIVTQLAVAMILVAFPVGYVVVGCAGAGGTDGGQTDAQVFARAERFVGFYKGSFQAQSDIWTSKLAEAQAAGDAAKAAEAKKQLDTVNKWLVPITVADDGLKAANGDIEAAGRVLATLAGSTKTDPVLTAVLGGTLLALIDEIERQRAVPPVEPTPPS